MPTGYEMGQFRNIERIANALERIARVLEQREYGVTIEEVERVREKELGAAVKVRPLPHDSVDVGLQS